MLLVYFWQHYHVGGSQNSNVSASSSLIAACIFTEMSIRTINVHRPCNLQFTDFLLGKFGSVKWLSDYTLISDLLVQGGKVSPANFRRKNQSTIFVNISLTRKTLSNLICLYQSNDNDHDCEIYTLRS